MRPEFLDRGPVGAIGKGSKSGWICEDLFMEWFEHFLNHVQPSARPQPTLLLADGHASHTNNLQLIERARRNNVTLLIFPSHCTYRLQPLDVAIYKSLKLHYDKEVTTWLRQHPGRAVQECNIAELVGLAYGQAANVRNATSAFAKTGIFPFNRNIFTDEDFAASDVTDRPLNEATADVSMSETVDVPIMPADVPTTVDQTVDVPILRAHVPSSPMPTLDFSSLLPTPKAKEVRGKPGGRKRKVAHAVVVTSSPYKNDLQASHAQKSAKCTKRPKASKPSKTSTTTKGCKRSSTSKTKSKCNDLSDQKGLKSTDSTSCRKCSFKYNDPEDPRKAEDWVKCNDCTAWLHENCAEDFGVFDDEYFVCRDCL